MDMQTQFVGREWLREEILRWWADPHHAAHLLLIGEPGIGKTAIAQQVQAWIPIQANWFCRHTDNRSFNPQAFIQGLSEQLANNLPGFEQYRQEEIEKRIHTSIHVSQQIQENRGRVTGVELNDLPGSHHDALEMRLAAPLERWAEDNGDHRVTLLVDGLDECLAHDGHPTIIELIATASLPACAGWILTSQPLPQLDDIAAQPIRLNSNDDHNLEDALQFVRQSISHPPVLEWLSVQRIPFESFCNRIVQTSGGNFLYLVCLVQDVLQAAQTNGPEPNFSEYPADITGYYQQLISRAQANPQWSWQSCRPVLGVLMAAQEPLDFDTWQRLAGVTPQTLQDIILGFERILQQDEDGRFAFFHSSFRLFLQDRTDNRRYWIDPRTTHQQIANACLLEVQHRSWSEPSCQYALRHLATHLRLGKMWEIIHLLFRDLGYLTTKLQQGTDIPLRQDLSLAITSWEGSPADCKYLCKLEQALRSEGHHLRIEPDLFAPLLYKRLGSQYADLFTSSAAQKKDWLKLNPLPDSHRFDSAGAPIQGGISAIASNDKSHIILTGYEDGTLIAWNSDTRQILFKEREHTAAIETIAISITGEFAITGSRDHTVRLWDINGLVCSHCQEIHRDEVIEVGLFPDNTRAISVSIDGIVAIWNTSTLLTLATLDLADAVRTFAMTPNGNLVALGMQDGQVIIWQTEENNYGLLRFIPAHSDPVSALVFLAENPDAPVDGSWRMISASRSGEIAGWIAGNEEVSFRRPGHQEPIHTLISDSSMIDIFYTFSANRIRVWSIERDQPMAEYSPPEFPIQKVVRDLSYEPEKHPNLFLAGGWDGIVRRWDLVSGEVNAIYNDPDTVEMVEAQQFRRMFDTANSAITRLAFIKRDAWIAAAHDDGRLCVWDSTTGVMVQELQGHIRSIHGLAAVDEDTLLSASADYSLRLWQISSGEMTLIGGHDTAILAMAVSHDHSLIATASDDGKIYVWAREDGKFVFNCETGGVPVVDLDFDEDGTHLATLDMDGNLGWLNAQSLKPIDTMTGACQDGEVLFVNASTHRFFYSTRADSGWAVRIWEPGQPQPAATLACPDGPIRKIIRAQARPDFLLCAGGQSIWTLDSLTGKSRLLYRQNSRITTMAINQEGNRVAVGDRNGRILCFDWISPD